MHEEIQSNLEKANINLWQFIPLIKETMNLLQKKKAQSANVEELITHLEIIQEGINQLENLKEEESQQKQWRDIEHFYNEFKQRLEESSINNLDKLLIKDKLKPLELCLLEWKAKQQQQLIEKKLEKFSSAQKQYGLRLSQEHVEQHCQAALENLLKDINKYRLKQRYKSGKLYICYAWAHPDYQQQEKWEQGFLATLRQHLKAAGITAILDIKDNQLGNNIYQFMEQAQTSDYVLVVGSQSLLKKHQQGISALATELIGILDKRRQDEKQELSRVLPILLSGDIEDALPPYFRMYTTVRSWVGEGYLNCLRQLIERIYNIPEEDKTTGQFHQLWQQFLAETPNAQVCNRPLSDEVIKSFKEDKPKQENIQTSLGRPIFSESKQKNDNSGSAEKNPLKRGRQGMDEEHDVAKRMKLSGENNPSLHFKNEDLPKSVDREEDTSVFSEISQLEPDLKDMVEVLSEADCECYIEHNQYRDAITWLNDSSSQFLVLYGISGIGKTTLAEKCLDYYEKKFGRKGIVLKLDFLEQQIICFGENLNHNKGYILTDIIRKLGDDCLIILDNASKGNFDSHVNILTNCFKYSAGKNGIKFIITSRVSDNLIRSKINKLVKDANKNKVKKNQVKYLNIDELSEAKSIEYLNLRFQEYNIENENSDRKIDISPDKIEDIYKLTQGLPILLEAVANAATRDHSFGTFELILEILRSKKVNEKIDVLSENGKLKIFSSFIGEICKEKYKEKYFPYYFFHIISLLCYHDIPKSLIDEIFKENLGDLVTIIDACSCFSLYKLIKKPVKDPAGILTINFHPFIHETILEYIRTNELNLDINKQLVFYKRIASYIAESYPKDYNEMNQKQDKAKVLNLLLISAKEFEHNVNKNTNILLSNHYNLLGNYCHNIGVYLTHVVADYNEAKEFLDKAISYYSINSEPLLEAKTKIVIGSCLYRNGDFHKSIVHLLSAKALLNKVGGNQESMLEQAFICHELGNIAYNTGYYFIALKNFDRSLEIRKKYLNESAIEFGLLMHDKANSFAALCEYNKANEFFEKSLSNKKINYKSISNDPNDDVDHPNIALLLQCHAMLLIDWGKFLEAEKKLSDAKRIYLKSHLINEEKHLDVLRGEYYSGKMLLLRRILSGAEEKYLKVLNGFESIYGKTNRMLIKIYHDLSFFYQTYNEKECDDAVKNTSLEKALNIYGLKSNEDLSDNEMFDLARIYCRYGLFNAGTKNIERSIELKNIFYNLIYEEFKKEVKHDYIFENENFGFSEYNFGLKKMLDSFNYAECNLQLMCDEQNMKKNTLYIALNEDSSIQYKVYNSSGNLIEGKINLNEVPNLKVPSPITQEWLNLNQVKEDILLITSKRGHTHHDEELNCLEESLEHLILAINYFNTAYGNFKFSGFSISVLNEDDIILKSPLDDKQQNNKYIIVAHNNIAICLHCIGIVLRLKAACVKHDEKNYFLDKALLTFKIATQIQDKIYGRESSHPNKVYTKYEFGITKFIKNSKNEGLKDIKSCFELIKNFNQEYDMNISESDDILIKQVEKIIIGEEVDKKLSTSYKLFSFFNNQYHLAKKGENKYFGFIPEQDTLVNRYP